MHRPISGRPPVGRLLDHRAPTLLTMLLTALLVAACTSQSIEPTPTPPATASPSATASPPATATQRPTANPIPSGSPGPTLAQLIGQKLMVAMTGTTPSADLLERIQLGEVGGVILFGFNITSASQLVALTKQLQAAATVGGQPPLLVSTDQEGGPAQRVTWIPPTMSPKQMGATGSTSTATSQGAATGAGLLGLGINVDLAPVADVPASTKSFMYQQGRTWSFDATTTANLADAFATGLESAGEIATMKHFPGLGDALRNTDDHVVTITATAASLDPGLDPYREAIGDGIPLIMLSNAWYTAWDADDAAGWSPAIGTTLLRDELGFTGVTITDSLKGIAGAMHVPASTLAVLAAEAGTDMILLSGSEASSAAAYQSLLTAAEVGAIPRAGLEASYARILALKARL